jgi:hypothetical protein
MMELLTRHVDRVGVYRPLAHAGPDHMFDLLRSRYRLSQDPATVHGLSYADGASLQAEHGTDELVSRLVDRFRAVAREYEVVLVLGSDYHDTQLPAELALNARLANEFGACLLAVVGGMSQTADSVVAEVHNANLAFTSQDCDVVAVIANRAAPDAAAQVAERLNGRLPVPVNVLPEDASLAAPTVAQIVQVLDSVPSRGAYRWTSGPCSWSSSPPRQPCAWPLLTCTKQPPCQPVPWPATWRPPGSCRAQKASSPQVNGGRALRSPQPRRAQRSRLLQARRSRPGPRRGLRSCPAAPPCGSPGGRSAN